MAGAVIGALRVVLGADSAALVTDLDKARNHLAEFGANVAKAGLVAGAAMAAGLAAISLGVRNTLAEMDGFAKQSQKIGIPVENLSALKHAADLSDVSMESLGKGIGKLSKAMVEAAAKPASEAANAFRALGVAVTDSDGNLRPTIDVIGSVAGKFEDLKDGAGKTAIAMAIFGKSGADLIPLLNSGQAGLAGMIAEARQLGLTIDTDTAKAAERFRDNLTRLSAVKNGIIVQLTAHMLPALEALSQRMIDAAKNSNLVQNVSGALKAAFDLLARGILLVADNIGVLLRIAAVFVAAEIALVVVNLGLAFVKLASAIRATGIVMVAFEAIRALSLRGILLIAGALALATGNFEAMTGALKDIGTKIEAALPADVGGKLKAALSGLGLDLSALEIDLTKFGAANSEASRTQKEFNYHALAGKTALDAYIDSTKKALAAQQAEIATVGMAAGAKEGLRVVLQGMQIATANNIPITDALTQRLVVLGLQAEQTALQMQGAQLIQAALPIWQQYQLEVNNTNAALAAVGATLEQVRLVNDKLAERFGLSWQQMGANIAGTMGALSQLTGTFARENKAMGVASKAFGIAQAIINTQIAVTKALATLPPPASYVAVALAIAQGAAAVATISAQKFATGGSFTVGGGISGTDNKMVPLNLASGERVKIEPNRYGDSFDSGAGSKVLQIEGIDPKRYYRGDVLRDLLDNARELINDGYKFA